MAYFAVEVHRVSCPVWVEADDEAQARKIAEDLDYDLPVSEVFIDVTPAASVPADGYCWVGESSEWKPGPLEN
jgi:hypothetical protein